MIGPKESTLHFLTRTYSSVGFCWGVGGQGEENWYHRLIAVCMVFYLSIFLNFLKEGLLDISKTGREREGRKRGREGGREGEKGG